MVRSLLLAEQVLLAAYQPDSGKCGTNIEYGLAGALLMELVLLNKIEIDETSRVNILDSGYTGDPELEWALYRAATAKDRKIHDAVFFLSSMHGDRHPDGEWQVRHRLLDRLIAIGILKQAEKKVLGLFPSTRFPTVDPTPHAELMENFRSVYINPPVRDPKTASILLGLHVRDWLPVVVEKLNKGAEDKIDGRTAKVVEKEGGVKWWVHHRLRVGVC